MFVAIATMVFTSCESKKSGKRVENKVENTIEEIVEEKNNSFQDFKEFVEKGIIDSAFISKSNTRKYYDFYFPEYKIDIKIQKAVPFECVEDTMIITQNFKGEYVLQFCSDQSDQNWTSEQKTMILNLLLSKKQEKKESEKK